MGHHTPICEHGICRLSFTTLFESFCLQLSRFGGVSMRAFHYISWWVLMESGVRSQFADDACQFQTKCFAASTCMARLRQRWADLSKCLPSWKLNLVSHVILKCPKREWVLGKFFYPRLEYRPRPPIPAADRPVYLDMGSVNFLPKEAQTKRAPNSTP